MNLKIQARGHDLRRPLSAPAATTTHFAGIGHSLPRSRLHFVTSFATAVAVFVEAIKNNKTMIHPLRTVGHLHCMMICNW